MTKKYEGRSRLFSYYIGMRQEFYFATGMLDRISQMTLQIVGSKETLQVEDLVDNPEGRAGELQRLGMWEC